jgi:hypothetical protein
LQKVIFMKAGNARRQFARGLLFFHFIGLALCLGGIFGDFLIDRHTRGADLQLLSLGRDLISLSSRNLVQTGFLLMMATGILMVLVRYGLRAPIWAWLKFGLSITVLALSILALSPATTAATQWAHWSAEHGQLAPQFLENIALAGRYGITILGLLLVTVIVAIWKPFSSGIRRLSPSGDSVETA